MSFLGDTTRHQQKKSVLDLLHSKYLGGNRGCHFIEQAGILKASSHSLNLSNLVL